MTMKYLVARRFPRVLRFTIHLDTTKTAPDPLNAQATIPDPAWTLTADYPIGKGERRQAGETLAQWRTRVTPWVNGCRQDAVRQATERLDELTDAADLGDPLSIEGTTF